MKAAYDAGRTHGPEGAPGPHDRIAGPSRIETAVALSRTTFAEAGTVVIAPADRHAEALVAAPLAARHGGPVLSVWPDQQQDRDALPDVVAEEVRRLQASAAIVVGDRLPAEVEEQLASEAGIDPEHIRRIHGTDEFAVARNVALELLEGRAGTVSPLLALGEHHDPSRAWPDALSASVVAARQQVPVLLTRPDRLPDVTREVLERDGIGEVRIVGGDRAIGPPVEQEVRELGLPTRRIAGANRFETSLRLAEELVAAGQAALTAVFLATGHDHPDAVAAGPAVSRAGHVLVLAHGLDPTQATEVWWWLDHHGDAVEVVRAIGGPAAVTDEVLRTAAGWAH